jgi:sulfur-carrier protein
MTGEGSLSRTLRILPNAVKPVNPVPLASLGSHAVNSAMTYQPLPRGSCFSFPAPQVTIYVLRVQMAETVAAIRVKVLFFGRLKEIAGRAEDVVDVPEQASIEQLFARCVARQPELARYRSSLVASCNQEFAAWSTALRSGDEVAFLPPVSGG